MYDPLTAHRHAFKLYGSTRLTACPVCDGERFGLIWQLPQTKLDREASVSVAGTDAKAKSYAVSALPTLTTPQRIYRFDMCGDCGSIFRNPTSDNLVARRQSDNKVELFHKRGLDPYRSRNELLGRFIPPDAGIIVDAACGSGQSLKLLQESFPDARLVGLEVSEPSVKFINNELGIEAHACDLDADDLDRIIQPGTVDFIILHDLLDDLRKPIKVLGKLVRALRPNGRLFYTARYYGEATDLDFRINAPIYITNEFRMRIPEMLGCRLFEGKLRQNKIQDVLEKL